MSTARTDEDIPNRQQHRARELYQHNTMIENTHTHTRRHIFPVTSVTCAVSKSGIQDAKNRKYCVTLTLVTITELMRVGAAGRKRQFHFEPDRSPFQKPVID